MPQINLVQAINSALSSELKRDDRVVVLGQDVGKFGGVFRATQDLFKNFGPDRVLDTPLCESGIVGSAIGMALYGLRPVPEIQFADFSFPAFNQIVSELSKIRYRSGNQYSCPMVIRMPTGGGVKGGIYHSTSPEAYFVHTAGLKVVTPSNPYDAKGLLIASIRDENPVIFLEPKRIYRAVKGEVPEENYTIELGKAKLVCEGTDATILAYGASVQTSLEATKSAEKEDGISVDLIDLRTLLPYDIETILTSVKKTGRVVIVHESPRTCGFGAELSSTISEKALLHLQSPIVRVTGFDTPFPYTHEKHFFPNPKRIRKALRDTVNF